MISISRLKLIRSLKQKKYRDQHGLYLAEGDKVVTELMGQTGNIGPAGTSQDTGHPIEELFATPDWIRSHRDLVAAVGIRVNEATPRELKKASNMVTPQQVLALVRIPEASLDPSALAGEPVLGFESVRDPGNLGTIIRTADWFGIRHLVCTPDSVDLFNPKVVQATMGAMTRVKVHYLDPLELLDTPALKEKPVCGTFLDGENIYEATLPEHPMILFGNESRGLSSRLGQRVGLRLLIPSFTGNRTGSESLNLASSVAVVCSEFRRRG